jgi:hypothetical protein
MCIWNCDFIKMLLDDFFLYGFNKYYCNHSENRQFLKLMFKILISSGKYLRHKVSQIVSSV